MRARLWGDQDMSGWQGQAGKCVTGIVLIGIGLSLFQTQPLVALPAGWGGIAGMLTARGILSLTAMAPDAGQKWIVGTLVIGTLITGSGCGIAALRLRNR